MENMNIYDDVSNVDLGIEIHKLEGQNKQLLQHIRKLETDIEKLCTELSSMKQIQQNLSKNISELYKTAKIEIQRKDRIICELREEIDNMVFRRRGGGNLKRDLCNEEEDRTYKHHDHKRFKNDLCKENVSIPTSNTKMHSSRSTPDMQEDSPHYKLEKISCERETDCRSGNDQKYHPRHPLHRVDFSRNKRFDRYNQRSQYNHRNSRRSRERQNRNEKSQSPDKYSRSRSTNKHRRSRSSDKFSRSQSSNRSDDIKRNRRSKSRSKYATNSSPENKNVHSSNANRSNYKKENYNDEKMLIDIKKEILDLTELEEGEITTESDSNLVIEETNIQNSNHVHNIKTETSSKLDVKSITIQEYRNRTKVTTTITTNEKNLKVEENGDKNVKISDNNVVEELIKKENSLLDNTSNDIVACKEENSSIVNDMMIDTRKSIPKDASVNTSICSSSSENTSFNASGTNNGSKLRRRRCVVIGIKDKV